MKLAGKFVAQISNLLYRRLFAVGGEMNPKGIPQQSPGLRACELPWVAGGRQTNPNGVVAGLNARLRRATTLSGLSSISASSQGSSQARNPGLHCTIPLGLQKRRREVILPSPFAERPQEPVARDPTGIGLEAPRHSRRTICATTFQAGLVVACLFLAGCLLKPVTVSTHRFILAPIAESEPASTPLDRGQGEAPSAAKQYSVGITSVKMPAYLLRNSIALRKDLHEIEYLEEAVWAERLDQSFQQTLAANLSTLLPSDRVYLSAWDNGQVKLRISVTVEQFDVNSEGCGTLIARWRITAPGHEKLLKSGHSRLVRTGPTPRNKPQVIVTTLSALTAEFSREMVQTIQQITEVN